MIGPDGRLSEFVTPTPSELAALHEAKLERREYKRNQPICRDGDPVKEVYLIADGWVGGSLEVNFGRKQLAKLYRQAISLDCQTSQCRILQRRSSP